MNDTPEFADKALLGTVAQPLMPPVSAEGATPHKKTPSGNTRVLHMNYVRGQNDTSHEAEIAHLRFFANVSDRLGLDLQIFTEQDNRTEVNQTLSHTFDENNSFRIIESPHPITKWAEDSVEYLENGEIAVLPSLDSKLLETAMTAGRRSRWEDKISQEVLEDALQEDYLWIPLGVRVNTHNMSLAIASLASTTDRPVRHLRAYIEGGNMIAGEDLAGNPIILIGKDAIDATANLYQLNRDQVREMIREDFGLASVEQIIDVEQPGQFHLDLAILFLGHGVVLLNDSRADLDDALEMAEAVPCMTTQTAAAKLQLRHSLETSAANDLKVAGLHVIREKLSDNTVAFNFFNGEFVTGKDGLHYYLTNGGPPEQEERFTQLMVQDWRVVADVIFSPIEAARKSLQELGGVGCRIKGMPNYRSTFLQ